MGRLEGERNMGGKRHDELAVASLKLKRPSES